MFTSFAKPTPASRRGRGDLFFCVQAVKAKIHPPSLPVCFVDVSTQKKFLTRSTMKSDKKETIDGVEYNVVLRDVTSASHPAYTGEKRYVDTAGRVEKFQRKFKRRR